MCQLIERSCQSGSSELDGESFTFLVHWREDMRRYLRDRTVVHDLDGAVQSA